MVLPLTFLALGVGWESEDSQATEELGTLSSSDPVSKDPFTVRGQSKGTSSLKSWEMDTVTARDSYAA